MVVAFAVDIVVEWYINYDVINNLRHNYIQHFHDKYPCDMYLTFTH